VGRRPTGCARGGRAGGGQKGGFKAAFEAEIVAEIEALVGTGAVDDWDFEAIETAVRREAMRVAARAVERRINADTSDHAGPTAPCACGLSARYAGRHDKTFESVLGPLTLSRAYYHCVSCETGFCPRDHALGLQGGALSPGVLRMVGRVGAMVSFEEGHELLTALAGVDVPTEHVERAAEALGREVAEDERRVVEPPVADEPLAPTLYLGMDGTGVPVRKEELVDRAGKQPDGSARTREVKLCTVWSAEGRDDAGTPVRDAGSISCCRSCKGVFFWTFVVSCVSEVPFDGVAQVGEVGGGGWSPEEFVDDGEEVAQGADGGERLGTVGAVDAAQGGQEEGGLDDGHGDAALVEPGGEELILRAGMTWGVGQAQVGFDDPDRVRRAVVGGERRGHDRFLREAASCSLSLTR
jgi:hypothetical protein